MTPDLNPTLKTAATRLGSARGYLAWLAVAGIMLIATAHLGRTALRAEETTAVIFAGAAFALMIAFRLGRASEPNDLKPRRLPWSTIPILLLAIWAANARLFGKFDVSAVLFHVQHSLDYDGLGHDIIDFSVFVLVGLILILCIGFLARRDRRMRWIERIMAVGLLIANPLTSFAYDRLINPNSHALDLSALYTSANIQTTSAPPKNLILIYLESMEATYMDPMFGEAADALTVLSKQGLRIEGISQIQDTGWTTAGLVASQCGIPLLSYGLVMENRMKNIETFLSNAECLATQLSERGYQTRFYGGAKLSFAGKGRFLTTHGYETPVGLESIPEAERGPVGKWGMYDDRVFELALRELETIAASEAPFLLSILTLGAHAPAGYPAPSCYESIKGAKEMDTTLLSVACTAGLTNQFIATAKQRGLLENTTIVLLSDHLSHLTTQTSKLDNLTREIFTVVISSDIAPATTQKTGSMIDLYPTLLELLNLAPTEGKAGLGVSLLSDKPTLLEQYGSESLGLAIRSDTALRKSLWGLELDQ